VLKCGVVTGLRSPTKGKEALSMLVLTRKSNQSIMIGDDIEVSVLSITGGNVRIGIQAPRDIPIFRKEIYLEIQQQHFETDSSARAEVNEALKRLRTD
jgi:carbon storage regulator